MRQEIRSNMLAMNEHLRISNAGSTIHTVDLKSLICQQIHSSHHCSLKSTDKKYTNLSSKFPGVVHNPLDQDSQPRSKRGSGDALRAFATALGKPPKTYFNYIRTHPVSGSFRTLSNAVSLATYAFVGYEVGSAFGWWGIPNLSEDDLKQIRFALDKGESNFKIVGDQVIALSLKFSDYEQSHWESLRDILHWAGYIPIL